MKKRKAYKDNIFCKYTYYLLPCFCIKKNHTIVNIWVHPRIKRHNFGSVIVESIMKMNDFENKKNDKKNIDDDDNAYEHNDNEVDDNEDDIDNDSDNNPTSIHKGFNKKLGRPFSSFFGY